MFNSLIKKYCESEAKKFDAWLIKHNEENPFPSNVLQIKNIPYIDDSNIRHTLDIFMNKEDTSSKPILINIHGGGLIMGSKDENRLLCADLCLKGFIVFSLEYPLVPTVTVQQILCDLSIAINKVGEISKKYSSTNGLYLCGDSAGAYLCTYLAALQNNKEMRDSIHSVEIEPKIKALGLQSGMFYTNKFDKIGIFLKDAFYGKNYKKDSFSKYINPESLIEYLPPCYLITANGDYLRSYSQEFYNVLHKQSSEHELLDIDDSVLTHAFAALMPEIKESQEANQKMVKFLKRY